MDFFGDIASFLVIAQETHGGEEEGGGSFLVSPNVGLMIWTLLAFGTTLYLLNKLAFPRIAEALDKRRQTIEKSLDDAARAKQEADGLLEEYRARLKEAREQAEDITIRARKAADSLAESAKGSPFRETRAWCGRRSVEFASRACR